VPAQPGVHFEHRPYLQQRDVSDSLGYLDWPLWAQILLIVGALTIWVPVYFVIKLCQEYSCFQTQRARQDASD
jgi:hypothetical protein